MENPNFYLNSKVLLQIVSSHGRENPDITRQPQMSVNAPFFKELEQLKTSLVLMGENASGLLSDAVASYVARDTLLAREVIERAEELKQSEDSHEERTVQIMALNSPVARDLRLLVAYLRVNSTIKRAGGLCTNIANTTLRMANKPPIRPYVDIPFAYNLVHTMWEDSIRSFSELNGELAAHVAKCDDEADRVNRDTIRQLLEIGSAYPEKIFEVTNLIGLSKTLERIGDLSVDISEIVIYVREGKHRSSKRRHTA